MLPFFQSHLTYLFLTSSTLDLSVEVMFLDFAGTHVSMIVYLAAKPSSIKDVSW